jgi:hypothetical protein
VGFDFGCLIYVMIIKKSIKTFTIIFKAKSNFSLLFPSQIRCEKMYEFVTIYCASEILTLYIIDTCSIISKYIIKNTNHKRILKFKKK